MSAAVRKLAVARAQRRREQTLRDISVGLQAKDLTLRTRVPTLGNRDAAVALWVIREQLEQEITRIDELVDEFRELAESETDEASE